MVALLFLFLHLLVSSFKSASLPGAERSVADREVRREAFRPSRQHAAIALYRAA
jgi:hypothetical protein